MHGIGRAGCGFGMELAGKKWQSFVADAFDGVVVGVFQPDFPAGFEGFFVDGEAVILAGDVAAFCFHVDARLVLGAVAEF